MDKNKTNGTAIGEQRDDKFLQLLFRSRNRFRAFVDAIPDAMCVLDSDMKVVSANRGYADWHGLHPREVIGRSPSCPMLDQPEIPDLWQMTSEAISSNAEISAIQKRIDREGRDFWLEARVAPLPGEDDAEKYVALVLRDVTRQKAMEEQIRGHSEVLEGLVRSRTADLERKTQRLEETIQQLRETESMKRDLFNMIVHDLKSPLAQVMANLEMLQNNAQSDLARELIDSARIGGDDMATMIGNLLDLERMENNRMRLKFEPTDPAELVRKAAGRIGAHARLENIQIETRTSEPTPPMILDRSLIERVLHNLLMNAIEFSPAGETIVIEPRFDAENPALEIAVIDHGPGVAEDQRETIFQKFRQSEDDASGAGTGLGLAFCKMAVQAHHGTIGVEPGPDGQGSRFTFRIPLLGMDGKMPIKQQAGAQPAKVS